MRRTSITRKNKSAVTIPVALFMVALLVVVQPASQWLCFFMPCGARALQQVKPATQPVGQALHACCRNAKTAKTPPPIASSCCKQKPAATGDCGQLPDKSQPDAACCGDTRNHKYLSGETLRLTPKFSHWQQVSYPLVAVLPPSTPDVAPKVIRHTLRDGTISPPASPFRRLMLGRAPPEVA